MLISAWKIPWREKKTAVDKGNGHGGEGEETHTVKVCGLLKNKK
jgi:hypothetical protein